MFLCEIPKNAYAQKNILFRLMRWPNWIAIIWKWASSLTELAGDGES